VVPNDNLPIKGLIPEQLRVVDHTQVPAGPPEQEPNQNQQANQLQVGMILLPDTLDIDFGLEGYINGNGINQ
jgi:hypothetical protein